MPSCGRSPACHRDSGGSIPINKVVDTFDEAVSDVADGSIVHIGGFGGPAEYPSYLIAALARKNVTGLTITGNHSDRKSVV